MIFSGHILRPKFAPNPVPKAAPKPNTTKSLFQFDVEREWLHVYVDELESGRVHGMPEVKEMWNASIQEILLQERVSKELLPVMLQKYVCFYVFTQTSSLLYVLFTLKRLMYELLCAQTSCM